MRALFVLWALVVGLEAGCGLFAPAQSPDDTQDAVDLSNVLGDVGEQLVVAYAQEDARVIEEAGSRAEALAELEQLDQKWTPIWAAWIVLTHAHDGWARVLDAGGAEEPQRAELVRVAWCGLLAALTVSKVPRPPAVLAVPIVCA